MQRWIVIAVVGALLFGLGGGFALWNYRENRPKKVWVPLVLNEELPEEKRGELAEKIKAGLLEGSILREVVKDTGLAKKLKLPSDEAAEAEVRKRLMVEVGEADVPTETGIIRKMPSINIGIHAQRKTYGPMGEVAMRIMKDVWKMLGIKEPAAPTI
ncbi:hypothetical protein OVA24_02820 [Luteolibacter sp. SL250]|uniref:hypothetical protein n=1 Tax=Luteolibacter sp. SL250 TaxID=2995170 RepID=UPI00226F3C80|nr:hypothetical protein [Luteolibacter sp. SL250]WAC20311.1 hypothetical protein OVA24_02820 [Luteolibacter sp. SL250]